MNRILSKIKGFLKLLDNVLTTLDSLALLFVILLIIGALVYFLIGKVF